MTDCVRCRRSNRDGAKFCAGCGEPLRVTCPACGNAGDPGARFCDQCGTPLAGPSPVDAAREPGAAHTEDAASKQPSAVAAPDGAEHRYLTVLFCDMVDSTPLSQSMDAEDYRELNRRFHQACSTAIEAHGGYVARYMGDGLLAYFGYPEAHEDDALRAARAGLEMIESVSSSGPSPQAAPPPAVRVGIASGRVVVGDVIGEHDAREHAVVGETPNLAARLQQVAAPGTVVVSESTHRLLGGMFDQEALTPLELKGFAEPQPAWVVRNAVRPASRFVATHGAPTTLVGRDDELAMLEGLWARAAAGEGRVALVCGEPGIGKSCLVEALRRRVEEDGATLVRYQCVAHLQSSALHPVIQQLAFAAGLEDRDDSPTRRGKLRTLLQASFDKEALDETVELFARLPGIGGAGESVAVDEKDAQSRMAQTLNAVADGLEGLAGHAPLLLVVEDVHWSDPTTLAALDLVVERAAAWRALVVITYRPGFEPSWVGMPHVTLMVLSRLAHAVSAAMIAALPAARNLPAELADRIVERADGIPLFLEELAQAVAEEITRRGAGNGMKAEPDGAAPGIPATLQESLAARLDQLGQARNVAQVAAVIGREFSLNLLAAVTAADIETLKRSLARLEQADLVRPRRAGAGATYVFKHALVRDAAYATLLRGPRRHWHARIARELESGGSTELAAQPELIAWHFAQAGLGEEAVSWWLQAGQRARERFANEEAAKHFNAALALMEESGGDPATARPRMDALLGLVACFRLLDEYDNALEKLDEAQRLATTLGDDAVLADIHHQRGNINFPLGNVEACLEAHRQAQQHARAAGTHATEARALGGLGDAYYASGLMRTANAHFRDCVQFARRHDVSDVVAANAPMLSWSGVYLEPQSHSLRLAEEAVRVALAAEHRRGEVMARAAVCFCAAECGEHERGTAAGHEAAALAAKLGMRNFEAAIYYFQSRHSLYAGEHDVARELLVRAWQVQQQVGRGFHGAAILGAQARLAVDAAQRRALLEQGEALLREGAVGHNYYWFYRDAMEAALAAGETDEVRRYAEALSRYGSREPLPWVEFHVRRAMALASGAGKADGTSPRELDALIAQAREFDYHDAARMLPGCRDDGGGTPGEGLAGASGGRR